MADRDWRPRRRGHIYCSPACGRGCTVAEYNRARTAAARLAKKMGPGWKPEVWENLGWHYCANKGVAQVHAHRSVCDTSYTVYFNAAHQVVMSGTDPVATFNLVIRKASGIVAAMQRQIRAAIVAHTKVVKPRRNLRVGGAVDPGRWRRADRT